MDLVSWSPFHDREGIFDHYDRLLSDRDLANLDNAALRTNLSWRPRADISESKQEALIRAAGSRERRHSHRDRKRHADDQRRTANGNRRGD